MAITNMAITEHDAHSVRIGRISAVESMTRGAPEARATTSSRGFVRIGRRAYVEVAGRRQ